MAQQYLPHVLAGKRYYHPSDQGHEAQIADRIERRSEARSRPARRAPRPGPAIDGMNVSGRAVRSRFEVMRKVADAEKADGEAWRLTPRSRTVPPSPVRGSRGRAEPGPSARPPHERWT